MEDDTLLKLLTSVEGVLRIQEKMADRLILMEERLEELTRSMEESKENKGGTKEKKEASTETETLL